ncbi:MAG TPA: CapA family protein [Steroidobacteraceae bacterium]|nr:CapA family protein [Steroidobacteraceae bacterium]
MLTIDLAFTGDVILDHTDPDHWLSGIAPELKRADYAVGHLEVPHTLHTHQELGDVPAPGANPEHIAALARAGFTAMSLAGNHMTDCGMTGVIDTIAALDQHHIKHTGAGIDLQQAKRPALIGNDIALLSYNCVGPESGWATAERGGVNYIRVDTENHVPIAPTAPFTLPNAASVSEMMVDIANAKKHARYVVVSLHKGIVHTPARLATYERPVAHAAIEAGADVVIGHHAHIVRGIELYRGKPVFHGLGNGCVVTKALSPNQAGTQGSEAARKAREAWAKKRKVLFGFEPDPAYDLAPFHPEAVNAMIGRVRIQDGKIKVGFTPVYVEAPGRPIAARAANRATQVIAYIEHITQSAGLPPINIQFDGEDAWLS